MQKISLIKFVLDVTLIIDALLSLIYIISTAYNIGLLVTFDATASYLMLFIGAMGAFDYVIRDLGLKPKFKIL